jgi:Co/Zn/Cd efflux system component
MSAHCHHDAPDTAGHSAQASAPPIDIARYRKILWIALLSNAAMFFVEIAAGLRSGSVSLLADAIDFAGDAANYGVSLAVLSAAAGLRSRTALLKAACMIGFGLFVLGRAVWGLLYGAVPDAPLMGAIAVLALITNLSVAWMLYAFREGDANMRSVWLCTRNDAISNIAVIAAALAVLGSRSALPDLAVAGVMASLAISGGWSVMRQARGELAADGHDGHVH